MFKTYLFQDGKKAVFKYEAGDNDTLRSITDFGVQEKYAGEKNGDGSYANPLIEVFESDTEDKTLEEIRDEAAQAAEAGMPDHLEFS